MQILPHIQRPLSALVSPFRLHSAELCHWFLNLEKASFGHPRLAYSNLMNNYVCKTPSLPGILNCPNRRVADTGGRPPTIRLGVERARGNTIPPIVLLETRNEARERGIRLQ